jgi:3',5'-cyclic AMP phosphodiesterase CpdA
MARDAFVIAQLSDLHCGSPHFDEALLRTAVHEVIALQPDLVLVGGDLTADGYAPEFRAAQGHLEPLFDAGLTTVVIPGNHDAKNVGHLHFRDVFGPGDVAGRHDRTLSLTGGAGVTLQLVAVDTSKPDLAEGEVGRERYDWIRGQLAVEADVRVLALHHHLVPVPGTGRERNTVWDAGDVLSLLDELGVELVLCGHKHVPHVWLVNGMLLVSSGTVSSHRLRGYTRPSFNVVEITADEMRVTLKYPGTGERLAARLERSSMRLDTNAELGAMFDKRAWGP